MTQSLVTRDPVSTDLVFRRASAGLPCWVGDSQGAREFLPLDRWIGGDAANRHDRRADQKILDLCTGPTLDLGCGPGRLTAALVSRGRPALGVDVSAAAVEMTIRRGGRALRRDIFAPLPGAGHWTRILLVDGNIGIGGDPVRVLRRARELLNRKGIVIAEVNSPTTPGLHREHLRWETETRAGHWFAWASVGADALPGLAAAAGLSVLDIVRTSGRYFARMEVA